MDTTHDHPCKAFFILMFFFLLRIYPLAAQNVVDTLEKPTTVETVDSAAFIQAKRTQLQQRFNQYNTQFLENISVAQIGNELASLDVQQTALARLVDSMSIERKADTLAALQQSGNERISRLRQFNNTITNYQVSLKTVSDSLRQLASDSLFNASKAPANLEELNALNKLHLQIRQKEIQSVRKLDSLQRLVNDASKLLGRSETWLANLSASKDEAQAVTGRRSARNIWSAPPTLDRQKLVGSLKATYNESKDISEYVKQTEWTGRIFLVLLSGAFFYWLYTRGRHIYHTTHNKKDYAYVNDILKTLVFLLTLLPIVSVFTPSILVQMTQLLAVLLLLSDVGKSLSKAQRRLIYYLVAFYLLVILTNSLVNTDLILRLLTIGLNLLAIYICYRLYRGYLSQKVQFKLNKYAFGALVIIHLIAILCNIFGYVEFARYWSVGGAVGMLQAISLVGFYHIVMTAFERQFRYVSLIGAGSRFDKIRTIQSIKKFITIICVVLSIVVLVINLHSVQQFFNWLFDVLDRKRHIGGLSFTFGNLTVGIIIIAIANWLQKHLAVLLGDTNDKSYTQTEERSTILSMMPIFRLLIIVAGFLIGLSALGIGLDKLTVIVSALSVGIGFGLQNIINNFISGIILIFEKPFRTGDFIELADKKGRVQEIGIRSSTLLTQEGSEVIIPNGDLLSGRLVNWTLSKSYSRISMSIKIAKDTDMDVVHDVLEQVADKIDYLMEDSSIEMLYIGVEEGMVRLKLNAWIVNIYNEEVFRSQLIAHLDKELDSRHISMVSI